MKILSYITESKASDWRGCLMLSAPSEIADMIKSWANNEIPEAALAKDGYESYVHCTILYGFPQFVTPEEVDKFVSYEFGLTPDSMIGFQLGNIKRFTGNPEYDVLVIEVDQGLTIRQMHYALKDKFNVRTDYPTYNPHVTLAYVKPGSLPHLDGNSTFKGYDVICKSMTYSRGPSDSRKVTTLKNDSDGRKEKDS